MTKLNCLALFPICFLACLLPMKSLAAETSGISREGTEWDDIRIAHVNDNKLPRILLIGDSITNMYSGAVDKKLEGKANVARLTTSHFLNDPMLFGQIINLLDNMKFDVIHFNNGMHGWQYSEADYEKFFPAYLAAIRKHAPNAKLIWATTTPHNGSSKDKPDARVVARNSIALKYVQPLGIPVDDLYDLVDAHSEYYNGDVHFNAAGVEVQASQVAAKIEVILLGPKRQ